MRTAFPVLLAVFMIFAPQIQAAACHCKTSEAIRRYRHRLSPDEERAETARLNREYRSAARATAPIAAPAPPTREAQQIQPAPQGSQLEQYLELRRAYDHQLWAYYRAFPVQTHAQAAPPAPVPLPAHARPDETYGQDAGRLDPWHGYNPRGGLANGY
jgi:hypothetical protein